MRFAYSQDTFEIFQPHHLANSRRCYSFFSILLFPLSFRLFARSNGPYHFDKTASFSASPAKPSRIGMEGRAWANNVLPLALVLTGGNHSDRRDRTLVGTGKSALKPPRNILRVRHRNTKEQRFGSNKADDQGRQLVRMTATACQAPFPLIALPSRQSHFHLRFAALQVIVAACLKIGPVNRSLLPH